MSQNGFHPARSPLMHPVLGANIHETFCPRCGGPSPELVQVGARNYKTLCACGLVFYGGVPEGVCPGCATPVGGMEVKTLERQERVPAASLCPSCTAEGERLARMVREGGIYFECLCGRQGAVSADSAMAIQVRQKLGIPPPSPCGVKVEKCTGCFENS